MEIIDIGMCALPAAGHQPGPTISETWDTHDLNLLRIVQFQQTSGESHFLLQELTVSFQSLV